jgi:hypothetical protein
MFRTKQAAYKFAYMFLDKIFDEYFSHFNDDFPVMLGSMALASDGTSMDSAYSDDWNEFFAEEQISPDHAYAGIIRLLKEYIERGDYGEIAAVKSFLENDPRARQLWEIMLTDADAD